MNRSQSQDLTYEIDKNRLVVIKSSIDEIIVLDNMTNRQFLIKDEQYDSSKIELILHKLNTKDFKFIISYDLRIVIKTLEYTYTFIGKEIFPDADLNEKDENMTNKDLLKIIYSLRYKVKNISFELSSADAHIEYLQEYIGRLEGGDSDGSLGC
jgi:hypothetical protein